MVFLSADGEATWCHYFQVWFPYYQVTQCNQKTKKDKHQHQSRLPLAFISLNHLWSTIVTSCFFIIALHLAFLYMKIFNSAKLNSIRLNRLGGFEVLEFCTLQFCSTQILYFTT